MLSHLFPSCIVWMCTAMFLWGSFAMPLWASGGGSKDKAAEKGHGGGGHGGGGDSGPPPAPKASDGYVHQWLKMPRVHAASVLGLSGEDIAPRRGRALVLVFLASWCEPCQEIVADVKRLEERYQGLPVDFFYVFAHDTKDDAGGFLKEHRMARGFLANHDILQEFHNPELPSIYVGDREGWLLTRYLKVARKDLDDLGGVLRKITAF